MGFIDFSIVAVALPQIRSSLGADFAQAQWVSNAYMLFLSALILIGGALGDRFGLRTVLQIGTGIFTVASLACALAWNTESLIAFRALQGIGAAIMIPGSMAIISINTPRAERGRALGIWVAASAIATSFGPLMGGFILTYGGGFGWRWIFAINLPFGLFALYILRSYVPYDVPKHMGGFSSIDWTGALVLTLSLAMIAAGLTYLGEIDGGSFALLLLGSGLVLAILGVFWELNHRDPLISMRLFSSTPFSGGNALTFLVWSTVGAIIFFLPMLLIVAWKLPPTYAGAMFLPFSLVIAALSPIAGRMVDRFGTRLFLTIGPAVNGIAFLAMAWAVVEQDYWLGVLPATMLIGVGLGLSASPLSTAIMNSVDDDHSGAASGINNMVARMANLFGVAGLGAFVALVYAKVVQASDLDPDIVRLMMDAGFGERLTGALYQVRTEELQATAMNHAVIALCLVMTVMCFAASIIGYLSQPDGKSG